MVKADNNHKSEENIVGRTTSYIFLAMLTLVLGWTCARVQAADRSLILQLIHEHVLEPQFISNGCCLGETLVHIHPNLYSIVLRYCPWSSYLRIFQTVCSYSLIHTSWGSCGRSRHNHEVSLQLWQGSAKGETGLIPSESLRMRSVASSTSWKPGIEDWLDSTIWPP